MPKKLSNQATSPTFPDENVAWLFQRCKKKKTKAMSMAWQPGERSYQGILGNSWLYEVPLQCSYQAGVNSALAVKGWMFFWTKSHQKKLPWKYHWTYMKDVGNLDSWKFGLMISCGNLQVHKIHPCSLFFVQDDTVCMNLYKRACAPKSSNFTRFTGKLPTNKNLESGHKICMVAWFSETQNFADVPLSHFGGFMLESHCECGTFYCS